MKNRNLKFGFLGLMIFSFTVLNGQDPQFSQFFNSSLYYNPATAGISQDLRFSSSYRKLWNKIPGDLSTFFVSVDYQWSEKKVGLGLLMLSDNEGLHNLRTQRFELIYSYRIIQDKDKMLQFGMSAFSINIKDLKNHDFIFTDQLDPIYGVIQQSSYTYDNVEPVIYPDWNAGLVYRQNFNRRKMTPTIGVSASHILRPDISLVDNKVRLPVKCVVHANLLTQVIFNDGIVSRRKVAYLNPGFVYEYQKPFQTFTIGTGFDLDPIRLGMWFRNQSSFYEVNKYNSVIINAGIVIPISSNHSLIVDYSYDSTISKLEFASGGAHEVTLIYNMSFPEKKRAVRCYNEWWKGVKDVANSPKSK
jgi:type IX secretion system PorP/SprF family membrane protein